MKCALGWLSLLCVMVCTSAAAAQAAPPSDATKPLLPLRVDGHGSLTWDGQLGLGFRADIPIVAGGLAHNARDELAISVGADFIVLALEGSDPLDIWPTAVLQWTLSVNDHFVFYPELGLAAQIDRDGWQGVLPNVGFGGRYYLWRSISVMGRFGWPMAISIGATF